jgi:3-dehydroquinate dehydratase type I
VICIPIMGKAPAAALSAIEKSAPHCDMIELRMDLIPNGNLRALIDKGRDVSPAVKVLVTNRSAAQGGKALLKIKTSRRDGRTGPIDGVIPDNEIQRVEVLKDAVALGCDFVDCELDTTEELRHELLSMIRVLQYRTKLIVSDHDFIKTPSLTLLKKRLHECANAGADVVKIVTYARQPEDNLRILELIAYARKEGLNIAAFCMGAHGMVSRIMASLLGSCITYASLRRGLESAPGQLTVKEIKNIFRILNVKSL